jgi:hypothetical protein
MSRAFRGMFLLGIIGVISSTGSGCDSGPTGTPTKFAEATGDEADGPRPKPVDPKKRQTAPRSFKRQ